MDPNTFIRNYETALATQDWQSVEPLMSNDVVVTFSNGSVHTGLKKVQAAYEKNFSKIKGEQYSMDNIHWLKTEANFAVYTFKYHWSGYVDDTLISGKGVGTAVIVNESGKWKLLAEHLGRL